jgi:hypothetical protein
MIDCANRRRAFSALSDRHILSIPRYTGDRKSFKLGDCDFYGLHALLLGQILGTEQSAHFALRQVQSSDQINRRDRGED